MSSEDENVRSFVAIELPAEVRAWCEAVMERTRRKLGPAAPAVRWMNPEGMHLTLKFLGAVPASQVPVLIEQLKAEMAAQMPFNLAFGRLGVFPGVRAPRVLWLATLGDVERLASAQRRVEAATVPLGFPSEKRAFKPHLTLGRVRESAAPEELAAIGALPAAWPAQTSPPFAVTRASLMQSRLGRGGARYTRLGEIPFG